MGSLAIVAATLGGAYILSRGGAFSPTQTPDPLRPPGPGEPGYVTLGGQPAGEDWNPSPSGTQKGISLAGTGVGALGSVGAGGAQGVVGTSGLLASTSTLGAALPFIGIGIAAAGIVLGIISKHHQQALANEGKVLNSALPRAKNTMVLVAQAAIRKEIQNIDQAQRLLDQIQTDYYNEVKPIQHGVWHFTGADMTADYDKVWIKRFQPPKGAPGYSDYHAPDPCNAACVVGHFDVEYNLKVVLGTIKAIFAGMHGVMVIRETSKHATQQGFPEIRMIF